jgi:hypothetical protein
MSRFRAASRAAIFARLAAAPSLGAPVHSNPPANLALNHILIGDIIAEASEEKGDPSSWYTAGIEVWSQTFSPAAMEAVADAVVVRMTGAAMTGPGRSFTVAHFVQEQPSAVPAEAGGPLYGRVLTFRFYVD